MMAATGGDISFRMRYTASVGLVRQYLNGSPDAEAAITDVLRTAVPSIAQQTALELFSAGKLTGAWKKELDARGIFYAFRRLADAENPLMRAVDPELERHPGEDTRTRPRYTEVPALPESE